MILVLIGTKAQYIKTAPVLLELRDRGIPHALVLTGQHTETFGDLEAAFGAPPAVMTLAAVGEVSTLGRFAPWLVQFARGAAGAPFRSLVRRARAIVVHGDTASTLLGALVGRLYGVPVAHLEAGLRSGRLLDPFPEELVRVVVGRLASLHLCPDEDSVRNLRPAADALSTQGNTIRDALRLALRAQANVALAHAPYAIASMHRHETLSNAARFERALDLIVACSRVVPVRFVLHPATRERLRRGGGWDRLAAEPAVSLEPRTDYFDFVGRLLGARFLLTDGGSNQEEAAMLGLPCFVMRDATERADGIGETAVLGGVDVDRAVAFAHRHAAQRWIPKHVDGPSPSSLAVDAIADRYAR